MFENRGTANSDPQAALARARSAGRLSGYGPNVCCWHPALRFSPFTARLESKASAARGLLARSSLPSTHMPLPPVDTMAIGYAARRGSMKRDLDLRRLREGN